MDGEKVIKQWTALLNEKADLLFPKPNSGIPGAPSNQMPPPGMEHRTITLYLDLNGQLFLVLLSLF